MRLVRPLVGLVLLAASGSVLAEEGKLSIGLWGSVVARVESTTVDATNGVSVNFGSGWGEGLTLGYGFSRVIEAELGISELRSTGNLAVYGTKAVDLGTLKLRPISAMVKVHPFCPGPVDIWIGAGGAWVWTGDLTSADLSTAGIGRVTVKSRAAFLAGLGADFRIVPHVWLGIQGSYFLLKPDSYGATGAVQPLTLNPTVVSAGFRINP